MTVDLLDYTTDQPNRDVHRVPNGNRPQVPPMDWNELKARVQFMLDTFIGQIAIAFGGINIFGWKPFEFLADWGQQRIQDAQDAYLAAINAQSSANYANSMLIGLTNAALPSDVPGGVSQLANFNGPAEPDWGPDFTRIAVGSGSARYGPNGSGHAAWGKLGGLPVAFLDRHNDPLATDYQAIRVLLSSKPEGDFASNELRGRCNAAQDTFVWAGVNINTASLGCRVGGTATTFASQTVEWNPGDIWLLIIGTGDDEREFILKRNGNDILRYTDTANTSVMGPSYRHAGHTASASSLFFNQYAPASCDVWSAADRLPTTLNI